MDEVSQAANGGSADPITEEADVLRRCLVDLRSLSPLGRDRVTQMILSHVREELLALAQQVKR